MISASAPRLTIVVLSYDRPELLQKALQSIAAQTLTDREILVIDNPSPNSARIHDVVAGFSCVRLLANATNAGFTGGMNQGLAQARGAYVYFTEDDIELDPDCTARLVDYLDGHPQTALAGPVMWNLRTPTIRCAGGDFTLGPTFQMRVTAVGQQTLAEAEPFETMFLPGAAIAAKTSVIREIGGFHPDFFMYGEDLELCARIRDRGLKVAIVPAARVYHHEPSNTSVAPVLDFHKQKNLVALYLLHAPLRVLPMFFARYLVIDGFKHVFRNRRMLSTWGKAWRWAAWRSPHLLAQRRKAV